MLGTSREELNGRLKMLKDRKKTEILRDGWGRVLWPGEVGSPVLWSVLLAVVLVLWLPGVVGISE